MALLGFESTPGMNRFIWPTGAELYPPPALSGSGPWDGEMLARLRNRSLVREHGQRRRSTNERSRD